MRPYIGITGFTVPVTLKMILDRFPTNHSHQLMVGVLVYYESMRGIPTRPKWDQQIAAKELYPELLLDDPRVLNLIHYAVGDNESFFEISEDLARLQLLAGPNLHGFQVNNLSWSFLHAATKWRREHGADKRLVLQLNKDMLESEPAYVANRLKGVANVFTDVLIDASGGQGVPLDVDNAIRYLDAIVEVNPDLGIGVAGGFTGANVHLAEPIFRRFPHVSTDAQNGLRNEENCLMIEASCDYTAKVASYFPTKK